MENDPDDYPPITQADFDRATFRPGLWYTAARRNSTMQTVTVQLPDSLYQRMRRRAREGNRSVEDEAAAIMERALADDVSPATIELLDQLPHLPDDDLWQAAHVHVPPEKAERMQALLWKQQSEGLTSGEEEEATQLQHFARRVMLIRADAAALLAERGHDVAELIAPF